jgi:hypothetical protein
VGWGDKRKHECTIDLCKKHFVQKSISPWGKRRIRGKKRTFLYLVPGRLIKREQTAKLLRLYLDLVKPFVRPPDVPGKEPVVLKIHTLAD